MSSPVAEVLAPEVFDRLHPVAITDPQEIRSILLSLRDQGTLLSRGTNRAVEREEAVIESVDDSQLRVRCRNFGKIGEALFLSGYVRHVPHFFSLMVAADDSGRSGDVTVLASTPRVVYRSERRDRIRRDAPGWRRIRLVRPGESGAGALEARVVDESGGGLGVELDEGQSTGVGDEFVVVEERSEIRPFATVCSVDDSRIGSRRCRVGLAVYPRRPSVAPNAEDFDEVFGDLRRGYSAERTSSVPAVPCVVGFLNAQGEPVVGLLDETANCPTQCPAVVIPSAWGKTKETLLPLARALVAQFEAEGLPLRVLRFDGVRKRGESHNDPECAEPHLGNLNYTFSQGAVDLAGAASYIRREQGATKVFVVSFSVASVEARRALADDETNAFDGWVSVVGATDPQSLIRVISGGVDYLGGAEAGVSFGVQDVQGLLLDIDRTASHALEERIAFLEDSRRDFARVSVPTTWISGRHDAWMDRRRVDDVLSFGDSSNRRHVVAETGHQLRSSKEAAMIFQWVASEVFRFSSGRAPSVEGRTDYREMRARQRNERGRLREFEASSEAVRGFWRDYLVGRDGTLGMELVIETRSFRDLMGRQADALEIRSEHTVVDLGSGIGSFARYLDESGPPEAIPKIIEVDFVRDALKRSRSRRPESPANRRSWISADLSPAEGDVGLPLRDCVADRVLLSLVINYVRDPIRLLDGARRLLRVGGLLAVSALRKDADTSRICVDGVLELREGRALSAFGEEGEAAAARALGTFINDAGRLLDLEEQGVFQFWDDVELSRILVAAGLDVLEVVPVFGEPAQAWLAVARRSEE
ncbi:MAG: class I SAM-dependent methyltransferase [bacterium]|nr:class I SAM-dependent methyltransferase [bacterium]